MITDLITVEQARAHLRIDDVDSQGGPDDPWLEMAISAVSSAIALWLKDEWRLYETQLDSNGDVLLDSNDEPVTATDSNGDPILVPAVRLACLIELSNQYRYREGEGPKMESLGAIAFNAAHGYVLGQGATALLSALRRPTVS